MTVRRQRAGARLAYEGHSLISVEKEVPETAELEVEPVGIERHRTAIKRYDLSKPVKQLLERGLLKKNDTFFDYGCGHGMDIEALHHLGYEASGWDPAFRPNAPKTAAAVVNLGYVLNVIEEPAERIATLREAYSLAERVLLVSTMVNGHGVRQVRRKFVEEKDERISAEQLLPRLRSRRAEQRRNILGELIRFAQLLGNRAPDSAGCIGAPSIEANYAAGTELRSGVLVAKDFLPQLWITREQPERDHAVSFAAAHCLREQEDRRARARAAQMAERAVHQCDHAIREKVLVEKLRPIDLPFEKSVEAEHGGPPVSGED